MRVARRVLKGQNKVVFSPEIIKYINSQMSDIDNSSDTTSQAKALKEKVDTEVDTQPISAAISGSQSNNKTAQDNQSVQGQRDVVLMRQGTDWVPVTQDSDTRKWIIGRDDPYAGYNLDGVVITGKMPRNGFGQPLYDQHGKPTQYDDGGMKDNLDWAATHVMYPAMGAVAAAPYIIPWLASTVSAAAPYVSTGARFVGKAFTPSTYINWIIPKIATRLGASAPTTAGLTSLIGAGADMGLAGYFAHEGYEDVKNAVQHPENLQSWTDYGKLGLDALAVAGPVGEANKTLTALNKGVRIPTLLYMRHHNIPFKMANWAANLEGKFLGNLMDVDYMDQESANAQAIRQLLYKQWNPFAGWLQRSRSWEARARQAALDQVQTSMDIFKKYWQPYIEAQVGHPLDLRTPESYLRDHGFSYLPYDKNGKLWKKSGNLISVGRAHRTPGIAGTDIYLNVNPNRGTKTLPTFSNILFTSIHEGEHAFKLDPVLNKQVGDLVRRLGSKSLADAYETNYLPLIDSDSGKLAEKAATNASVLHFLGIKPEEASNIPIERLIRQGSNNKLHTVFSDMNDSNKGSAYLQDYHSNIVAKINQQLAKNRSKGIGKEETFRNFAEEFAKSIRESLKVNYKKGGKI